MGNKQTNPDLKSTNMINKEEPNTLIFGEWSSIGNGMETRTVSKYTQYFLLAGIGLFKLEKYN